MAFAGLVLSVFLTVLLYQLFWAPAVAPLLRFCG